MVMHSNERGECCLRTLVDRQRKRYDNAVDVVVRLHDPTDPSTECTAPLSSAHFQLDDVPQTVGERSNFKKIPTHTQDHVMHSNEGESVVYVPNADRLRKR